MQKKLNRKLTLSRETLRYLTPHEMDGVKGAGTTSHTNTSNITDTCATCVGVTCHTGC